MTRFLLCCALLVTTATGIVRYESSIYLVRGTPDSSFKSSSARLADVFIWGFPHQYDVNAGMVVSCEMPKCPEGDEECSRLMESIIECWSENAMEKENMKNLKNAKECSDVADSEVSFMNCTSRIRNTVEGETCEVAADAGERAASSVDGDCDRWLKMAESCDNEKKKKHVKAMCGDEEARQRLKDMMKDVVKAAADARAAASAGSECRETICAMMFTAKSKMAGMMKKE